MVNELALYIVFGMVVLLSIIALIISIVPGQRKA